MNCVIFPLKLGGLMILILVGSGTAVVGGGLGLRAYLRRRKRDQRRQRSVKNRARQFGWEMVFGPRKLRLTHERSKPDAE